MSAHEFNEQLSQGSSLESETRSAGRNKLKRLKRTADSKLPERAPKPILTAAELSEPAQKEALSLIEMYFKGIGDQVNLDKITIVSCSVR
jgi:hypothetical protein